MKLLGIFLILNTFKSAGGLRTDKEKSIQYDTEVSPPMNKTQTEAREYVRLAQWGPEPMECAVEGEKSSDCGANGAKQSCCPGLVCHAKQFWRCVKEENKLCAGPGTFSKQCGSRWGPAVTSCCNNLVCDGRMCVEGSVRASCSNVRFSRKLKYLNTLTHITEDLGANDYPVTSDLVPFFFNTNAASVIPDNDCELRKVKSVPSFEGLVETLGGLPSHAPDDEFWIELEELTSIQLLRQEKGHELAKDVIPWFPLPNLWSNFTMNDVAEAVRKDFPGLLNVHLIIELLSEGLEIDNDILYQRCNTQFLHTQVALSDLNTWAVGTVAPINFRAKWYAGRARPEEVAWRVKNGECDTAPQCLKRAIDKLDFGRMEEFTAYTEGAPTHPSWPAMHSAAASISMWLPVVAKLTPEQLRAAKMQDLAVSMGRSIAGVHYLTDNIDGLKMGQEVLARELPAHLEERYCADPAKVKEKIEKVRFNWDKEREVLLSGYEEQHHDVCP